MAKEQSFDNWYTFYKQYVQTYNLIIVVSLVPFCWLYVQLDKQLLEPVVPDGIVNVIGSIFLGIACAFGLWTSFRTAKTKLKAINSETAIREKLKQYYRIQMDKFIQYEIVSVMLLISMWLFQPVLFASSYLFVLFLFSLDWPKFDKVAKHLNLTRSEQDLLAKTQLLP